MEIPEKVTQSLLYKKIQQNTNILSTVISLRNQTILYADTISRTVPSFTDHSIKHMDALWNVAEQILTKDEIENLTLGEAFLLSCSFYLHDIGMAYAATKEGLDEITQAKEYKASYETIFMATKDSEEARKKSINYAIRLLHSDQAIKLSTNQIAGTSIFLFESKDIRDKWGETCGKISASHNWDIEKLDVELGKQERVPLPDGNFGDLGYIACILRLIDFAHINRDRASITERFFRETIDIDSLRHWMAQENIDGPWRDENNLVYRGSRAINDVDAWWLYFEMLKGLDEEIRKVRRYLEKRTCSSGRLSLQGVKGIASAEEAASYIPTDGFLPIEINLRTGSIERLVNLLAGESLYGPDPMAAVRELIQNSRDAIILKKVVSDNSFDTAATEIPIKIKINTQVEKPFLEIIDTGIGMSKKVITDYLITIASSYWTSQFIYDFPTANERGFQPVGRFGIGFLSVFMLGDEINVYSNREGEERYHLQLQGVGRKGVLRMISSQRSSGTTIKIFLKKSIIEKLNSISSQIKVYAPLIPLSFDILENDEATHIQSGWMHSLDKREFFNWLLTAVEMIARNHQGISDTNKNQSIFRRIRNTKAIEGQEYEYNDAIWPSSWPEYKTEKIRLLASDISTSILCSGGIAIQTIYTPGYFGVIDIDKVDVDVSRAHTIKFDRNAILKQATIDIRPQIIENINKLCNTGLILEKIDLISNCIGFYGTDTILKSSLSWINTLKMPGEVYLISSADLLEKLSKTNSIFIGYGLGPWSCLREWNKLGLSNYENELAIVLDNTDYSYTLGYERSENEKIGKLSDLWPRCIEDPIFKTIIRIITEAWEMESKSLLNQEGWCHKESHIFGLFQREI